jgi:uncharacterized protein
MGAVRRLCLLVLLVAVGCSSGSGTPAGCPIHEATASFSKQARLDVQVADDDASREQGLMGVTDLPENHGMAFVWDAPTDATFWMKDTLIPLSIAFVGQDNRVVSIREMTPCAADPCETYGAAASYTTALEANANWFADHHVAVGDRMTYSPVLCS